MKPEDDDALRAALAAAHRGDAAQTPPFHQVWGAARRPVRGRQTSMPWLVTCASLAAALGLATWLVGRLGPQPAQLPSGTSWIGPTDFLLDTPGSVTLRTIPELVPSIRDLSLESGSRRGNP